MESHSSTGHPHRYRGSRSVLLRFRLPCPKETKYSGSPNLYHIMENTIISTRVKAPANHCVRTRQAHSRAVMKRRASSPSRDGPSWIPSGKRALPINTKTPLRIATWNVLTMNDTGYQVALVNELAKYNISIAALTEARLPGHDSRLVNGATIIHSGGLDRTKGVALVLRPPISNSLTMWHPISSRLLYARLRHQYGHLSLVVTYAPTEDSDPVDKDNFYDQLAATIQSVPNHDELLVLGDMNANPGPPMNGFEDVHGPYGIGMVNDNSHRLLSLCSSTGLAITGSWFQRRDIHRYTWISNDGFTKKELDHILARPLRIVKSYRVFRGAEAPANTDHRLLVADVKIHFQPQHRHRFRPVLDVQRLREDPDTALQYNVDLQNRFSALDHLPEDVETAWSQFRNTILDTAKVAVGYMKPHRKPWLSRDTIDVLEAKAHARLTGNKGEYKRLQGVFRAKAKHDRESYYQSLASEAEEGLKKNNLKSAYRVINRIRGTRKAHGTTPILKADGSPCANQDETLQRWREYFSNALNHPPAAPCQELGEESITSSDDPDVSTDIPTLDEVRTAIQKLRHGRAAGPDELPPELLKCAIGPVSSALHELFLRIWSSGKVPVEWKSGILLALYKGKGPRNECSSHRPITLLSVPGKVFSHILLARLNPLLTSHRRPEQSGFTGGRSTMDAILALRLLSEIHREFNQPLQVAYVDLKAAFDSVDRQALWQAMRGIGVPTFLLSLIRDLHEGSNVRIRVNGAHSEAFMTSTGVRQGCVLAPALFCRAMDWIMERVMSHHGIQLPEHRFSDLDYADDVTLLDTSTTNLAETLDQLETEASHLGLHISWAKTKLQNLSSAAHTCNLIINGKEVENVTQFTYLGSVQSSDGRCTSDVSRRIGLAASAMRSLQRLWSQSHIKLCTKLRFYQTCVLPVLLYGSETWTLLEHDKKRLQAFHLRCQRQILNVRWFDHISNDIVSSCTGLTSISETISRRRMALFGHVARLDVNTPAHGALVCAIARRNERHPPANWKRLPGRPRRSWIQQIGDGSCSAIAREWNIALGRGHSISGRLAQRTSAVQAN